MFQHCVYPVSSFGHCCLFWFITLNCFLINYHDADVVFTWLVCFFMFLFNFNHVVIILNLFFSYYIFLIKFHHCVLVYIHMFVSHVQCFSYLFLRYPCFYMFSCLNWQEHRCMSQMSFFKVNFWTPSSFLEDTHLEMEEPIYNGDIWGWFGIGFTTSLQPGPHLKRRQRGRFATPPYQPPRDGSTQNKFWWFSQWKQRVTMEVGKQITPRIISLLFEISIFT
jgi:hypothetical protein